MNKKRLGYLYIVLTAIIFSTMEIMLKQVHGVFAPLQITVLRFLVGGLALLPLTLTTLRRRGIFPERSALRTWALTGLLNVSLAMVLYQMAVTYTKASAVAVIFSSNSVFFLFLAFLLLGETVRRNNILALALQLAAILVIVEPWNAQIDPLGAAFAILSSLLFALYSVLNKRTVVRYGALTVTCFCFLFGSLELLTLLLLGHLAPIASFYESIGLSIFAQVPILAGITTASLPYLAYICLINSAAGFVCHMKAVELTSAKEAGLIFFIKPALAPVLALIILGEAITANMALGIVLFLAGSAVSIVPGLIETYRAAHITPAPKAPPRDAQD